MMMQSIYVGVDTSNYTTSICAVDQFGAVFYEDRRLLQVPIGKHGLQQSEALFQHLTYLPDRLDALQDALIGKTIKAVGVSSKPRPRPGSYMPVFLPGLLAAKGLATGANASLWETTHQEGHIAAAQASINFSVVDQQPFLVYHLSGGTTDLLWVKKHAGGYAIRELFTSLDLHVGQFIDRIGVAMGLAFPAGKELEKLAQLASDDFPPIPSTVKMGNPSFSGPLSAATRLLEQGVSRKQLAASVLRVVANSLEKSIRYAMDQTGIERILLVGGVASNQLIRERLCKRLGEGEAQLQKLYFSDPYYASDNAYGVALIARSCEES